MEEDFRFLSGEICLRSEILLLGTLQCRLFFYHFIVDCGIVLVAMAGGIFYFVKQVPQYSTQKTNWTIQNKQLKPCIFWYYKIFVTSWLVSFNMSPYFCFVYSMKFDRKTLGWVDLMFSTAKHTHFCIENEIHFCNEDCKCKYHHFDASEIIVIYTDLIVLRPSAAILNTQNRTPCRLEIIEFD